MAMTMEEYVNAYYGGTLGVSKRYGIRKDDTIESTDPAGAFNTMFGAKVYNQLNTNSEVFKLLKKEPWTQSGWRVMTARHSTTAGVAEGGAFPATEHLDLTEVTATLKEVVTPWEMTSKAELLSQADDGLGDLVSFMRKENGEAHAYYIDQMLLGDSDTPASNNFESLDRVTISDAAANALCSNRSDADIYDLDKSGTTAWADAFTQHNSDTPTALTLAFLDNAIESAMENGANYSSLILLTGFDTYQDLKALMRTSSNAAFQYNLAQGGAGGMNGVTGEAGLNFDSRVGAYDGIPIFLSQHIASESDSTGRILLLDMDNLAFRVAAPTTYLDHTNMAVRQALAREYAFLTAGELICYRFNTQGSIRDLDE